MRIPAIPRSATRLLRPAVPRSLPRYTRWTSTAVQTQETATPIPAAAAAAPPRLVHELEGVYDILEGQVGGEEAWGARVQRAIRDVQLDQPLRLGGTSLGFPGDETDAHLLCSVQRLTAGRAQCGRERRYVASP